MRAPVIYSRICEFTLAEAVSEYDHMYLPLSTLSELHEYEMEAVGRGALPVDDSSCLRHESRAQNLRTGEFSRGMVGSAGTCQPCGLGRGGGGHFPADGEAPTGESVPHRAVC